MIQFNPDQTLLTLQNLQAVSAPGVMINTAVIHAVQQKDPVTQAIVINKLSLLFNVHVRKELVSDTATQLFDNTQAEQVGSSSTVQPSSVPNPDMEGGAVGKQE